MTVASMVIWSVWLAFVLFMAALYIYRTTLTRDEEDQIFLDDAFAHERTEQAVITSRVSKIEPLLRVSHWLVAAMSLIVVAYYVRDILAQLNVVH